MNMESVNIINCPQCGYEIDVNEVLYEQINKQVKEGYEEKIKSFKIELDKKRKELENSKKELNKIIEMEVNKKIEIERNRLKKQSEVLDKERKNYELMKKSLESELTKKQKELEKSKKEMNKIIAEKVKKETNKILEDEKEKIEKKISKEYKTKVEKEISFIRKRAEIEAKKKMEQQILFMQKELKDYKEKSRELNRTKIEIERLKREKEDIYRKVSLEKERELTKKLREEQEKIKKEVEDSQNLKIKEREKIIDDLRKELENLKRKTEQSSQQLQGEIQELEIKRLLENLYPEDDIIEIKKGQTGADIIHIVRDEIGKECGKILYESKRTKKFSDKWIQKLRDDNIKENANVIVLITESMPPDIPNFHQRDGVWVCPFKDIKPFSLLLRYSIIEIDKMKEINKGRESKMELIYNYLTSQEFRSSFESIIEGFKMLKENHEKEKNRMELIWKEREKQLERILRNAIQFYGSIKGIVGSSIPPVNMLEGSPISFKPISLIE